MCVYCSLPDTETDKKGSAKTESEECVTPKVTALDSVIKSVEDQWDSKAKVGVFNCDGDLLVLLCNMYRIMLP